MPSEEEEILHLIAEELASGRPPEMVAEELVQAGLPREEAIQVVQAVSREVGGGRGGPMREPPRHGSWFTSGYFWMIVVILVLLYVLFFVK